MHCVGGRGRFYWSSNVIPHTYVLPLNWSFHLHCNNLRVAEPRFSLWYNTSLSKKDAHDLPSLYWTTSVPWDLYSDSVVAGWGFGGFLRAYICTHSKYWDHFCWACRKNDTCIVVIKDTRHISLYLFTKANKMSWMPGDVFMIWQGGGSLYEYKSEFIHWSPCFCSLGFFISQRKLRWFSITRQHYFCNYVIRPHSTVVFP